MEAINSKAIAFIKKHHVLTLATSVDSVAHCANIFYAWDNDLQRFIFTSEIKTKHAADAKINSLVAGSIVLETKVVGKVQGLQIRGIMQQVSMLSKESCERARRVYLKRFPYAAIMDLELWILEPTYLKLTDNTLGFGKKLIWHKDEQ